MCTNSKSRLCNIIHHYFLERLVSLQLLSYIEQSGLLPPSQSGFRAHHSTETVLLSFLSDMVPRQFVYGHFVYDTSSIDINFRLQTFRLLLYTSIPNSYTSNFYFSKSLFSSIPTSTYTMIPFSQSHFH